MKITSSAFQNNEYIPKKYTCEGDDVNPPLQFEDIPAGTKSLVLMMIRPAETPADPLPVHEHWIVWNIPVTQEIIRIDEDTPVTPGEVAFNQHGAREYTGPCPRYGDEQLYIFNGYALDTMLEIDTDFTRAHILKQMSVHIIAVCELRSVYKI